MPTLEVSGGAGIIVGHAERLQNLGHDVLIVAPRAHPLTLRQRIKKSIGRDILVTDPKNASILNSSVPAYLPKHLHKIVEDDVPDADVIISSWWETAEWIKDFSPTKGAKVHFIQHYEGFSPMPANRVDDVWRLPFYKITIAQWLVNLGRERFGIRDIALVPNAVDDCFRRHVSRTKQKRPTVGFLFHKAAFKDFPTTRAAIDRLSQVRLLSFGSMIPNSGELPTGTEFHHLPSRDKIAEIYRACDVWLSTSITEGFNLPPLEAMATGTPAVCGRTGRPLELIKDGVNGYLAEAGDVEGFAQGVLNVLNMSDTAWRDMSAEAEKAVKSPTWHESTEQFERALTEAIATLKLSN